MSCPTILRRSWGFLEALRAILKGQRCCPGPRGDNHGKSPCTRTSFPNQCHPGPRASMLSLQLHNSLCRIPSHGHNRTTRPNSQVVDRSGGTTSVMAYSCVGVPSFSSMRASPSSASLCNNRRRCSSSSVEIKSTSRSCKIRKTSLLCSRSIMSRSIWYLESTTSPPRVGNPTEVYARVVVSGKGSLLLTPY